MWRTKNGEYAIYKLKIALLIIKELAKETTDPGICGAVQELVARYQKLVAVVASSGSSGSSPTNMTGTPLISNSLTLPIRTTSNLYADFMVRADPVGNLEKFQRIC